jgi:hypothetical protein
LAREARAQQNELRIRLAQERSEKFIELTAQLIKRLDTRLGEEAKVARLVLNARLEEEKNLEQAALRAMWEGRKEVERSALDARLRGNIDRGLDVLRSKRGDSRLLVQREVEAEAYNLLERKLIERAESRWVVARKKIARVTQELDREREFLVSLGDSLLGQVADHLGEVWKETFNRCAEALQVAFGSGASASPGDFYSVVDQAVSSVSKVYAGEKSRLMSMFFDNISARHGAVIEVLEEIDMLGLAGETIHWYGEERTTVDFALNTWLEVEMGKARTLVKGVKEFWDFLCEINFTLSLSEAMDNLGKIFVECGEGSGDRLKAAVNMMCSGFPYTNMGLKIMVEREIFKSNSRENKGFLDEILTTKREARDRGLEMVGEGLESKVNEMRSKAEEEAIREQYLLNDRLEEEFNREHSALMRRLKEKAVREHIALTGELEEKAARARISLLSELKGGD